MKNKSSKPAAVIDADLVTVTIISIWSKCPERRRGNVAYSVKVPNDTEVNRVLEHAFSLTNQDDRPLSNQVCSTSCGDILVFKNEHYLVQTLGFQRLTLAESEKIQKLTSRDTGLGYDFLVKNKMI